MKSLGKSIALLCLVGLLAVAFGCGQAPHKKILGQWKGTDTKGWVASLIFKEDGTLVMVMEKDQTGSPASNKEAKWVLDDKQDPMHLDMVVARPDGSEARLPMIARFLSDKQLQLRMGSDMRTRPTAFTPQDDNDQITLAKQ